MHNALGWDVPKYAHISLILGEDRKKMSKRHGATSVTQYEKLGYLPEAVFNFLALLGWSPGGEEEILTKEMKDIIASLGELVKADPRHAAIQAAIAEYERCEELNGMIAEYNTQQNLLSDVFAKTAEGDENGEELRDTIQNRIDQLYDEITGHPVYTAYVEAKGAFDALTNEIYAELQFVITGSRPCNHDCSSCGGSCQH